MQTPTKKVKRGRKPASECSGDFCQLCKCAFKVKFGDIDDIKGHTIILVCRHNYNTDSCILVRLPLKLLILKKIYSKYHTLSRTCCMSARTSSTSYLRRRLEHRFLTSNFRQQFRIPALSLKLFRVQSALKYFISLAFYPCTL